MGFHNWTGKYKKLDKAAKATEPRRRRRWRWMKVNGRRLIRGLRLSRCRKLKIKRKGGLSMAMLLRRRIGKIYGEVVKRVNVMESVCPQILLCCHWGLPVLSHSTLKFSVSKSAKNYHAPLRGL